MKQKLEKGNNGITLIALVITIIVLLILAAVSIATLTGENGILTKAQSAKVENTKSQAEEDVKLAVGTLQIEESIKEMTQEEKRQLLENELKQQQEDSTVAINGVGFLANHRGYEVAINSNYKVSIKEPFDTKEWDKTACNESSFIWESDNPEDGEAYHTIIGYADNIQNEVKLKIPSRCHEIRCDEVYFYNAGRTFARTFDTVELPDTVSKIGAFAFSYFELTSIRIPESVENIDISAFNLCNKLENIVVDQNNLFYDSRDKCNAIIETETNTLIKGGNNSTIPNGITSIGTFAFSGCAGLTSVTIPESVTSIEWGAFSGCTNLISVTIPDSVISIETYAFKNCTGLISITIPDSVTTIGSEAFDGCASLTSVTIPNSVETIGYNAFKEVPHIYYYGPATEGSPWGALAIN